MRLRLSPASGFVFALGMCMAFCPVLMDAASISNGAPAMDLLGQYDSVTNPVPVFTKGESNNGPGIYGFSSPFGVLVDTANHRLFVADSSNYRVLVYNLNTNNTLVDRFPDLVLGQTNFTTSTPGTTQSTLNIPYDMAYDSAANHLFVLDQGNHRILVFSGASLSNGMNANTVIGQSDFVSAATGTTQSRFDLVYSLAYDSVQNRLFAADRENHRVLVFSGASLSNGMNANKVLGQTTFTSATAGTTQSTLNFPVGLTYDTTRTRLFVSDEGNHRIMVFSGAFLANAMNANKVLGQANFTGGSAATTQTGLNFPEGLAYDSAGSRLFVSDQSNHRVLVFSGATLATGMNANKVLGQTNFTSATFGTTQSTLFFPYGLAYEGTSSHLFVVDQANSRILVFSGASLSNGMNANDVLGEFDDDFATPLFTKGGINNGPNRLGFNDPTGIAFDTVRHRLFVCDESNNRVLVYNLTANNTLIDHIPDFVLGQANFHSAVEGTTQSIVSSAWDVVYDQAHDHLFVSDWPNSRILVFSGASLSNGMNANTVIGQANFTSSTTATTQSGLNNAFTVAYDSTTDHLFVSDYTNYRVMVFSGALLSTGMNANTVIGQANFTSATSGITQSTLNYPADLAYDTTGRRLFVADSFNNRILVFSGAALSNGMNANAVLGQVNFTTRTAATTQTGLNQTESLTYDNTGKRLFVGDSSNRRLLVFDGRNIQTGMNASNVLGQADFTSAILHTTQSGGSFSDGMGFDPLTSRIYFSDSSNNRILIWSAPVLAGKVFSDEGTTGIGSNKIVKIAVNGNPLTASGVTDAGSQYILKNVFTPMTGGTLVSLYLDNGTEKAVTVTTASGGSMTGMHLYQNRLIVRSDSGSVAITNTQIGSASNGDTDISAIYTVNNGTLIVPPGRSLWIWSGKSFSPGGSIRVGSGITIAGTLSAGNTVVLSGTLLKKGGGTFTANSSIVLLNGGNQTLSGALTFSTLTKSTPSTTLTFAQGQTFTITNGFSFTGSTGGLLSLRSSNAGATFTLNAQGSRLASLLDVADSIAFGSSIVCQNCLDSGNNTNWIFLSVSGQTTTNPSSGGGGGGGGGGGRGNSNSSSGQSQTSSAQSTSSSHSSSSVPQVCSFTDMDTLSVLIQGVCITFHDVPLSAWYASFVKNVISLGLASGYKDDRGRLTGYFGPANSVTLAEIAKMALLGSKTNLSSSDPHNRSARNTWAAAYIRTAEDLNLSVFASLPDTNRPATRGEVASILVQVFGIPIDAHNHSFSDLPNSHPYRQAVLTLANLGIISGDDNATTVRPNDPINRAEIAKLLSLLLEKQLR